MESKSGVDKLSVQGRPKQHRWQETGKSTLQSININQTDVCGVVQMQMRT